MRRPDSRSALHRDLATGPIVWLGIIVGTCLLLVLFQYILWLIVPVLIAIVAYYILSPIVDACIRSEMTRPRAVLIVTILLTLALFLLGLILTPKVSQLINDLPKNVAGYTRTANDLIANARSTLSRRRLSFSRRPRPPTPTTPARFPRPRTACLHPRPLPRRPHRRARW